VNSLLRSEWTKLWSVRFGAWCTAVFVFVVLVLGVLAAATTQTAPEADLAVEGALTGFGFGQLVLVVFGILAVTSEFGTGSALVSFIAVPRRVRVLLAKTVVVGGWAALLSAVLTVLCAVAASRFTYVDGGISLTDPAVLRVLGLQVAVATLITVLAVGVATVVRSSAGSVGAATALVFFAPLLVALAPDWAARSATAMPALRVGRDTFLAESTTWQVGTGITAAWAAGLWILGAVLLERRDV
jgi:ABC-2 type transport system permease protein